MRRPEGVVALQGRNDNNPGHGDSARNATANVQTERYVKNELTFSRLREPTTGGCRQSPNILALTALSE